MLYKHYKGNLYRILGEGRHSETLEPMTIYVSVSDGLLWVRPTEMFHELVEFNGFTIPRFIEVEES